MKQRLIGAAVLLALGVIFIPMILDGTGNPVLREIPPIPQALDAVDPRTLVIPKAPPMQEHRPHVVQKSARPYNVQPATPATTTASNKPVISEEEPTKKPPVKTQQATKPKKQPSSAQATAASPETIRAWAVQVGSFNTSDKALKLRSTLRSKGFKAYVEKIRKQKKIYYRVRIGPVLNRNDADNSLKKLKKAGQKNAYVVRHP
ncbi:MAG TPA: hypothetical protein ENI64_09125 [Gammaproteobacteria bacterium]|nr:hypothetical protein [Gammaproteobacteria bacterium]